MKIYTKQYVNSWDLEEELNIRIFDTLCAEGAENDSYICIDLSDDYVQELTEDLEWQKGKCSSMLVLRIENELKIVEYFRNLGIKDDIGIYISW